MKNNTAKILCRLLVIGILPGLVLVSSCRGRRGGSGKGIAAWFRKGKTSARPNAAAPGSLNDAQLRHVIEVARSYTGTPHVMGGMTRAGIDCSGLVLVSYRAVGKELPRNSSAQHDAGRAIDTGSLREGDLVFFTDRKGGTRLTHVGMVTEVRDGKTIKFIHTTNSLGVVENNLFQPYWQNLFLGAVRVQ